MIHIFLKMADEKASKRARKPNWTKTEIWSLVEAVQSRQDILLLKFKGSNGSKKKMLAWTGVQQAVEAVNAVRRTVDEIKKKWKDLVANAKRDVHQMKYPKTGGGPQPSVGEWTGTILDVFGHDNTIFTGIENGDESGGASTAAADLTFTIPVQVGVPFSLPGQAVDLTHDHASDSNGFFPSVQIFPETAVPVSPTFTPAPSMFPSSSCASTPTSTPLPSSIPPPSATPPPLASALPPLASTPSQPASAPPRLDPTPPRLNQTPPRLSPTPPRLNSTSPPASGQSLPSKPACRVSDGHGFRKRRIQHQQQNSTAPQQERYEYDDLVHQDVARIILERDKIKLQMENIQLEKSKLTLEIEKLKFDLEKIESDRRIQAKKETAYDLQIEKLRLQIDALKKNN